jgi:hypothetical protein
MDVRRLVGQAILSGVTLCSVGLGTAGVTGAARLRAEALSPPSVSFDGQGNTCFCAPSDATGDVGPSNYVQAVNLSYRVFQKNGTPVTAALPLTSLFGSGACAISWGDPIVQYDQLADRWLIAYLGGTGVVPATEECVAVSQSSNPAGPFYTYDFNFGGNSITDAKLGVWPDAYYLGMNVWDSNDNFLGPEVVALDRSKMLLGQPAAKQTFGPFPNSPALDSPLPADLEGSTLPAPGTPNFFFGFDQYTQTIGIGAFHVDWTGSPPASSFTVLPPLTSLGFSVLCPSTYDCVPQAGTVQKVDGLGFRLMYRAPYRVIGGHDAVLLTHAEAAPGSGVAGVRWYEIRNLAGGFPSIFQLGDYAPNDGNWRWNSSIAMDRSGNVALGFSESGAQVNPPTYPGIRYTGRLAGDPPGAMTQAEQSVVDGTGSQQGVNGNRWGDYSTLGVDPVDGCTFWYTNQYYATTGSDWRTRIAAFRFAPNQCGQPTAVSVARFAARRTRGRVAITWRLVSPAPVLGFEVFRNGVRLNRRLIPARRIGAYRFLDRTARRGALLTYRLRIVDVAGRRSWYGISVVPAS